MTTLGMVGEPIGDDLFGMTIVLSIAIIGGAYLITSVLADILIELRKLKQTEEVDGKDI